MPDPFIHGPESIQLEGRQGARYWVHHSFEISGRKDVDDALASYPLVVFTPQGRDPAGTPLVIGLQGIAAPFQWNGFLVPTLLDMGIACALFDTPLAGERSLIRHSPGDLIQQLVALLERGVTLTTRMVMAMMDMVARDLKVVASLLRERHNLSSDRLALFGVSMGCLLSSLAFTRDGLGQRLLGVIGHADLRLFARSYAPSPTPFLASPLVSWIANPLSWRWGKFSIAARDFLLILNDLRRGKASKVNPMTYVQRVEHPRLVRFLLGRKDPLVRPQDGRDCAARFPDGKTFEAENLAHGQTTDGSSFVDHVRYFIGTQLSDWKW